MNSSSNRNSHRIRSRSSHIRGTTSIDNTVDGRKFASYFALDLS